MIAIPWHVTKTQRCPVARPWGVVKDADGSLVACHPTMAAANQQMMALYAQEGQMSTTTPATRTAFIAPIDSLEWRESRTGKNYTLTGHAAVFNRWSEELHTFAGSFREMISPGAFGEVLADSPDVRLLINHDENFPLARTKSKTLELREDSRGLFVKAQVGSTSYANDLRIAMERGDVDQMSFAFTVADGGDEWDQNSDAGEVTRTITRVGKLFDVSVVTFPAYADTEAAVRELRHAIDLGKIDLPIGESDLEEREVTIQETAVDDDESPDAGDETADDPSDPEEDDEERNQFRQYARDVLQREKEHYLRLTREIVK